MGSPYPDSIDIQWSIRGTSGRLTFYIILVDIEWQEDCLYDYVELQPAAGGGSSRRYCGRDTSWQSYAMASHEASVIFHADYSISFSGFQLDWQAVSIDTCTSYQNQSFGTLASVNYPTGYINDLDCVLVIDVLPGYRVFVQFYTFLLNTAEPLCSDYLQIGLNGTALEYSVVLCANVSIQEGCPLLLMSVSSSVQLYFHTNGGYNQQGYNLTYMAGKWQECRPHLIQIGVDTKWSPLCKRHFEFCFL